jgi:hypothetical protein
MNEARGIDSIAKAKKPKKPIMRPDLRSPFYMKIPGMLSPEMRDRTIIEITTSSVLNNMLKTMLLIAVVCTGI